MSADLEQRLRDTIRSIPDFPKPDILFRDITPILLDAELFEAVTAHFAERYRDEHFDVVLGIESRGFIFGAPLAHALGLGFGLIRKPGKLPYEHVGIDYELEYGHDRLELHTDVLREGSRALIVDDLLATGGTARAAVELATSQGAQVECAFLIELDALGGGTQLGAPYYALLHY